METTLDEKVQTLLGMGFCDEGNIRRALDLAKNDLNEAVSFLTCEMPMTSYETMNDVEMNEITANNDNLVPCYPPTYEEAMSSKDTELPNTSEEDRIDFPYECLVELEGRVFTDNWSIPFRKEESLAKCLKAATKLIKEGLMNADENCTKFLDRCLPECFNKLLTSGAVQRWYSDVQEGIYDMLSLFIELIVARLKYSPLPLSMLHILATAFDPECSWNSKNKYRSWQHTYWTGKLGSLDQCYARSSVDTKFSEPRGWMISLINEFCDKGGLDEIQAIVERSSNMDATQYAALLQPFSLCADWLNRSRVKSKIAPIIERAVTYVRELSEEEFKLKKLSSLSELLIAMKGVCKTMWAEDVSFVDELRLEITLRMIKCPHFNAKMNALKEVTKLIEESKAFVNEAAIDREKILDWLVENHVLRISLEGHIDQSQYSDKIRTVVQFIGDKLTAEELTQLWNLQNNASLLISENVQSIISGAAPQFNSEQLDVLFHLIHKSWLQDDEKARQQLVSFIGRIGHSSKQGKEIEKVLNLLWDLAHLPKSSPHLVELALHEHHSILGDAYLIKDAQKKSFIVKCIEDIKKDQWIVPALRQFQDISKTFIKYKSSKSDRTFLHDLNRTYDLLKLAVNSLVRCHQAAVESAKNQGIELNGNLLVDDRYKHSEYVWWHLSFLKFLLKDGDFYLPWNRARDIWDTLYANREACSEDKERCCDWFIYVLNDLEQDAVKAVFRERLTKVDVMTMNRSLFDCFINFLESTNLHEQKMKRMSGNMQVEKQELTGNDFLWRICLECQSNSVANRAISALVRYSYLTVSQKLKKDIVQLHFKFLTECYKRLHNFHNVENGPTVADGVSIATKTLAANVMPDVAQVARRSNHYLAIERLLTIVYTYICDIEASYTETRSLLPHGEFYRGSPITLDVRPESIKLPFNIETHGNETVRSIRRKIANELDILSDHVQIVINERVIPLSNDRLLLENCDVSSYQVVIVRTTSLTSSMQIDDEISFKNNALIEMEQRLPSVVALSKLGNRVFDILFQLSDLDQSEITSCVRKLLLLLPTDPRIRRSIENGEQAESDAESAAIDGDDPLVSMDSDASLEGLAIDNDISYKTRPFDSLFRVCSPDMNLFRLRYNLEVLSGLLNPVDEELQRASLENCASFMHNFIQQGGIHTVLNVLQREIVSESIEQFGDADTRRGCYAVALDIAKHLLCVAFYAEHTPGCVHSVKIASLGSEAAISPLKRDSFRVGSSDASATPTKRNRKSISQSPVVIAQEIPHAAKVTVQIMPADEFSSLIVTLVRITWFAAAYKLDQLTASVDVSDEGISFLKGRRWSRESSSSTAMSPFRHASTSSVSSSGSAEPMESLYTLRPAEDTFDKSADSLIARQALELLVSCFKLRTSHLECFFDLSYVGEFIIDIVTRPIDYQVRECAVEQLYQLSTIPSSKKLKSPRQRLLQILQKARVPFWHQTTLIRPKVQFLVRNCLQFFTLKCSLLVDCIAGNEQKACGVDEAASLEEEISWLNNFEIPISTKYAESSSARHLDNLLLTGHFRLIKILISSPKVNKQEIGSQLIGRLLSEFLFPASKLIMEASSQGRNQQPFACYIPKCNSDDSRSAAFDVLIELCKECTENLSLVASQLISMHHYRDQTRAKEFDFAPLVSGRPDHGFVGLKNGGATCYMNSVLQQLYMIPDIARLVLGTEAEHEAAPETTILYQLQKVFAHLHHSQLQFHVPTSFWKTFKMWGQEVNIREQQDAFEFFTNLTDQVDEYLKEMKLKEIFDGIFRGFFCDQKTCDGCSHKYEREEPYFALNLPVKSGSLEDSLRQFVAGEKLEGDNAYFCEKCNEKRSATKRTCIKSLPPILTIQLKRFFYDWEAGRSLKFDHYFRFPHEVDMHPYLHDGRSTCSGRSTSNGEQQLYRLVGVVIHSGQVQAGHYYSLIKDRRGTPLSNPYHGRWYKFNDVTVEEFEMSEQAMEEECFGGTFTTKVYERGVPYDEERLRYWNAYLLFYERLPDNPVPVKGRVSFMKQTQVINSGFSSPEISPPSSPRKVNDIKLSQLTNLIKKGDQRGIFSPQIPSSIMQLVREENLQFMRNRGVYSESYFNFIILLVQANLHCVGTYPAIAVTSLQLAIQFLYQTYFRTKRSLQTGCQEWQSTVATIFKASPPACVWFAKQLQTAAGMTHTVSFVFESPNEIVRSCFSNMISEVLRCLVAPNISKEQRAAGLSPLLSNLLSLLGKEVTEHVKSSKQYFEMIASFVASGKAACQALLCNNGLAFLMRFLLGVKATASLFCEEKRQSQDGSGDASVMASDDDDVITRRWSSVQSREFHSLHASIIYVILQLNLKPFRSDSLTSVNPPPLPSSLSVKSYADITLATEKIFSGNIQKRYIRELLFAAREISTALTLVSDVLLYCSYNNQDFSDIAIAIICNDISSINANELKPILFVMLELLSLEDTLHRKRLQDTLERSENGFLLVIKESQRDDEPKCYQCVKALVQLASRSDSNRQFLLEISTSWSWSVAWLKKKMSEHTWSSQPNRSNEGSMSKQFQRTMSAQHTLDEATALLAATQNASFNEDDDTSTL